MDWGVKVAEEDLVTLFVREAANARAMGKALVVSVVQFRILFVDWYRVVLLSQVHLRHLFRVLVEELAGGSLLEEFESGARALVLRAASTSLLTPELVQVPAILSPSPSLASALEENSAEKKGA